MAARVVLDGPILRITLSGALTAGDLFSLAREMEQIKKALGRIPDRIVDMSNLQATGVAFNLTLELARRRRETVFPNAFRSAILAPARDTVGFARIFRILSNNPQIEVRVFATVGEAEAWLGFAASKP